MRKPCCDKQDTNKGAWSKQEDQKLIDYIRRHGEGCWRTLPQAAGLLRCGKSCRLRWINYLRPDLKRGNFAEDEEDLIIKLPSAVFWSLWKLRNECIFQAAKPHLEDLCELIKIRVALWLNQRFKGFNFTVQDFLTNLRQIRWSLIAGRLPGRTDNEVKNYWNSHLRRKLMNMGIDPNNHRLNQSLTRSQNLGTSGSATSSASKDRASQPMKTKGVHNDQVSDAGSCLEDATCGLPDLNLDLKITIPSPSIAIIEEERKLNDESTISRDLECALISTSPTLLLFR